MKFKKGDCVEQIITDSNGVRYQQKIVHQVEEVYFQDFPNTKQVSRMVIDGCVYDNNTEYWSPCESEIKDEKMKVIDLMSGQFCTRPNWGNKFSRGHLCIGNVNGIFYYFERGSLSQQVRPNSSAYSYADFTLCDQSAKPITKQKENKMDKTTLKLLFELLGASEEVKDATNSKFVGIITKDAEYTGYIYCDSKEEASDVMAQPKMELHKLYLFEKSCVLAQKPRKVIEIEG